MINFFKFKRKNRIISKTRYKITLRDKFNKPEIIKKIKDLKKSFKICPLSNGKINLLNRKTNRSCSLFRWYKL